MLGAEEASEALRVAVEGGVVVAVEEAIAGRARGGGVDVEDDAKGAGTATGRATAAAAVAEWMSKEAAGPAGGVRQRALVGSLRYLVLLLVLPCSVCALNSSTAMQRMRPAGERGRGCVDAGEKTKPKRTPARRC